MLQFFKDLLGHLEWGGFFLVLYEGFKRAALPAVQAYVSYLALGYLKRKGHKIAYTVVKEHFHMKHKRRSKR